MASIEHGIEALFTATSTGTLKEPRRPEYCQFF
jgi:hypothetical protein